MPRTAGKLGRKPAVPTPQLKSLGAYLTRPLPPAQPSGDVSGGITGTDWQMYGNQDLADCADAAFFHGRMAKNAATGAALEVFPESVWHPPYTEYCERYNGGADDGVILSQWFQLLVELGLCLGAVPVNHLEMLQLAQLGHGNMVGVDLGPQDMPDFELDPQVVWTDRPNNPPDPDLGHATYQTKWSPSSRTYVTWSEEQDATEGWAVKHVAERWAFATEEDEHLNLADLRADMATLPHHIG